MCKKIKMFGIYDVFFNGHSFWIKSPFGVRFASYNPLNGEIKGNFQTVTICMDAAAKMGL